MQLSKKDLDIIFKYVSSRLYGDKLSEFPIADALSGEELTPIIQDEQNRNVRMKDLLSLPQLVEKFKYFEEKFRYFDRLLSFDSNDCMAHPELIFRPNFYTDDCDDISEKEVYDWSFCGTIHSDRLNVIRQIRAISQQRGYTYDLYPYLQSRQVYWLYRMTRKEFLNTTPEDFIYEKLTFDDSVKEMAKSRVIVDIEHPDQSGLTTRTLITVAMGKKLITTNEDTVNYDFYDPDMIWIIDRTNVEIPEEFMNKPNKKPSPEFYEKYSLRRWVLDVLGEEEE
jgi:hypothetical protein